MPGDDLSKFHAPLTKLFDTRKSSEGDHAEMLESFHRNGYIAGIRLLSEEQITVLRAELAELTALELPDRELFYEFHANESNDPASVVFHALGAWRVSRAFHDLLWLRPMVEIAELLLGGPVRLWHDQLFVKPAREGGVVAWHQDYSYWTRTRPVAHLTCWIGLDDSNEGNGCVRYVPGSHRWELLPRTDLAGDMESVLSVLSEQRREQFRPVPMILKAGEASFHHPMMLHGSYANTSDRPRRAIVVNFIRDGVISDSDQPLLQGIPVIPKGEAVAGRFFPLLSAVSAKAKFR
jgi:ectoine hydroxylase-related dioxygenase (phytanoyl-CoA dioxygenase family)